MELDRGKHSQGGNELPPIDQTLDFVRRFAYGNTALETLMKEYVFETRINYVGIPMKASTNEASTAFIIRASDEADEDDERIGLILAGVGLNLINKSLEACSTNTQIPEQDRFRNHVVLGKTTENPEIDELFRAVRYFVLCGEETMNDKFTEIERILDIKFTALEEIWEAKHPGQIFAPDSEIPFD